MARTENNYIRTYSGKKFWPLDPRPEDVDIVDIAHALSNQCRFTGHTSQFYSVASHSLFVSYLCPSNLKLAGLLHDADEAYLVDLATPVKHAPEFAFFVEASTRLHEVVMQAFDLPAVLVKQVKPYDKAAYEEERQWYMPTGDGPIAQYEPIFKPAEVEQRFLATFYRLTTEKNSDRYPEGR